MQIINNAIKRAVWELEWPEATFVVEHPGDEKHGDYSSNIALAMFGNNQEPNTNKQTNSNNQIQNQYKNPRELAEKLVTKLQIDTELASIVHLEKIEVAGPGFINFWLREEYLVGEVELAQRGNYGDNSSMQGKKVMVEYTDPNPFKEFHIGHLMSNAIGESIASLLEAQGAAVKRVNYQGDVGLHVAKSVWGMRKKLEQERIKLSDLEGKTITERQRWMGQAYALGAQVYDESKEEKGEMDRMNKAINDQSDQATMELYKIGRQWSLDYFETIYARLGTKFDEYFFESEAGEVGLEVVEEGLVKKVLEEGENGAVIYKGEKDGLHTRVFRNALGLATYEGKELGLAKTKYQRYRYDQSYIVTANEITEYFKVLLRVMEQLYPRLAEKTVHLPHGMMKLKTGKMSSRTGKVVTGEELLDKIAEKVWHKINERTQVKYKNEDPEGVYFAQDAKVRVGKMHDVANQVAVGALKYLVLRQELGKDVVYDLERATSFDGDTGPYLQYTYVRASSVLRKAGNLGDGRLGLSEEVQPIVRWIARYPEVVGEAGAKYAPHMVAGYLYELAARFNTFYNKHQIVGSKEEGERVAVTRAVAAVLKRGLNIMGIQAPEVM